MYLFSKYSYKFLFASEKLDLIKKLTSKNNHATLI